MYRKYVLTVILTLFFLSGCQSTTFTYNPENHAQSSLAEVLLEQGPRRYANDYLAEIEYIWNEQGEELSGRLPYVSATFSTMKMQPGVYRIQAKCANAKFAGSVEGIFNFQANGQYRIYCEQKKDRNTLGFAVSTHVSLKLETRK
ncbi:hypothetical protein A7985_13905 [Pseudoalteromonas luteoviolacea]|uniref:Lipoprotein n=1 Tax=Pseudoalteromonas luteoviolacea TaxID=43657 RepID=A0A1C0TPM2_9GAMM|nr:hypothetical protein [Pseudoalteromonas luteoviolacea]MBQ4811846.1 hypothetical protein [Pseudoalteromonas luteoviolacea]OCQ20884.1 hypothetical protein A7985_13905 [Pseudoalteromonas luteoviolacea]